MVRTFFFFFFFNDTATTEIYTLSLHDALPIHGAGAVANLLARAHRVLAAFETTPVWLNGAPAVRVEIDGQVAAVSVVVENGRVTRIYAVANPQKLTRLDKPAELVR